MQPAYLEDVDPVLAGTATPPISAHMQLRRDVHFAGYAWLRMPVVVEACGVPFRPSTPELAVELRRTFLAQSLDDRDDVVCRWHVLDLTSETSRV
jgi:hypothetical protein